MKLTEYDRLVALLSQSAEPVARSCSKFIQAGRPAYSGGTAVPAAEVRDIYEMRGKWNSNPSNPRHNRIEGYELLLARLPKASGELVRIHTLEWTQMTAVVFTDENLACLYGILTAKAISIRPKFSLVVASVSAVGGAGFLLAASLLMIHQMAEGAGFGAILVGCLPSAVGMALCFHSLWLFFGALFVRDLGDVITFEYQLIRWRLGAPIEVEKSAIESVAVERVRAVAKARRYLKPVVIVRLVSGGEFRPAIAFTDDSAARLSEFLRMRIR